MCFDFWLPDRLRLPNVPVSTVARSTPALGSGAVFTQTATRAKTRTDRDTVVAVFHSHAEAQQAVCELKDAGFTDKQIGIAAKDRDGSYQEQTGETMAGEGATAGAVGGLGIGALWGLGIVAGVLPAIGPVIAGGALAAIAASAAGTAAAGGLIGALVGPSR